MSRHVPPAPRDLTCMFTVLPYLRQIAHGMALIALTLALDPNRLANSEARRLPFTLRIGFPRAFGRDVRRSGVFFMA